MTAADYESKICQSINKVYGAEKLLIFIEWNFIQSKSYSYIVKDVRSYLYHNIEKYYSYKLLYTIMKNELRLTYKMCKPRQNTIYLKAVIM